jgi:hypothetical protein
MAASDDVVNAAPASSEVNGAGRDMLKLTRDWPPPPHLGEGHR